MPDRFPITDEIKYLFNMSNFVHFVASCHIRQYPQFRQKFTLYSIYDVTNKYFLRVSSEKNVRVLIGLHEIFRYAKLCYNHALFINERIILHKKMSGTSDMIPAKGEVKLCHMAIIL